LRAELRVYSQLKIYVLFFRHLDISQIDDLQGTFEHENKVLKQIVASLPHLVSLDISGTNLAGKGKLIAMAYLLFILFFVSVR